MVVDMRVRECRRCHLEGAGELRKRCERVDLQECEEPVEETLLCQVCVCFRAGRRSTYRALRELPADDGARGTIPGAMDDADVFRDDVPNEGVRRGYGTAAQPGSQCQLRL